MKDIDNYSALMHLDGNVLAAIDIETSGKRAGYHEIIQIGVQVLDRELKPHTKLKQHYFYRNIKPHHPERASNESLVVSGIKLSDLECACTQEEVADQFENWWEELPLAYTKRLIPLAHNWTFELKFLDHWLGVDNVSRFFHPVPRDSMLYAASQNDRAHFHGFEIPYRFVNLSYLCKVLRVENPNAHDALSDARTTAEIYRRMMTLDYGEF